MVTRGSPKPLLRVRVLLPLPRRRGLHLVRGGFFQKPPLTRSVAPPIPLNPAGFDGRRTGAASSRSAFSSRRLFSKAPLTRSVAPPFPPKPVGFDGRRTGAASSWTALGSRRLFSKAAYDTTHCFSFPNIGRWTERSVGRCGQAGLSKAKKEKPLNSSSFKGLLAIVPGWPYP